MASLGWLALVATCVAAIMTAANLGARVTGYGFVIFLVGAVAWCAVGYATQQWQLFWSNAFLTVVDAVGIWRWLYRRAKAEDATEASKDECAQDGERLIALSELTGQSIEGRDGILGKVEGALIDCENGAVRHLVVAAENDAQSDLRRLAWSRDIHLGSDRLVTRLDKRAFAALPRA